MKNSLIIGCSIVIAAIIVVLNFPRYQYFTLTQVDPETKQEFTSEYVFDMVSGKLHSRTMLMDPTKAGNDGAAAPNGFVMFRISPEPSRSLMDLWSEQRSAFGSSVFFDNNDWTKWQKEHVSK